MSAAQEEKPPATAGSVALEAITIKAVAQRSGWSAETVDAANVLITPVYVRQISPVHQVTLERLDVALPREGEWESEDLYTMQGQLAPTKRLLERVALLAGVEWDVPRCRFDVLTPEIVVYTAVGGIRGPGGKMTWIPATKEWNREVELVEIHERAAKKKVWTGPKGNRTSRPMTEEERASYIASETARAIKHRIPMTESKARLRVLRALLGIAGAADRSYWSRPFLIPRIDVILDPNDPAVRARLIDEGMGARRLLGYDPPTADSPGASVVGVVHPDGSIEVDAIEIHEPGEPPEPEPVERDPEVVAAGETVIPAAFGGGDRTVEDLWAGDEQTRSIVRNVAKLPPGINDELRSAASLWIAAIAVEAL